MTRIPVKVYEKMSVLPGFITPNYRRYIERWEGFEVLGDELYKVTIV